MASSTPTSATPYRQIRASYDDEGIVLYQAYNEGIAKAAVEKQKLNASKAWRPTRMTWVKPSWSWMMYRSGYSYKDSNQARILAIKVSHAGFREMLSKATFEQGRANEQGLVRIQWDPERTPALGKLSYRSIQIGIPGELIPQWIDEWTLSIEDVTETARELKATLEKEADIATDELVRRNLIPEEKPYEVSDELKALLRMDGTGH